MTFADNEPVKTPVPGLQSPCQTDPMVNPFTIMKPKPVTNIMKLRPLTARSKSRRRREENRNPETGRHEANERGGDGSSPDSVSPSAFEMGTGRPHPVRWQALAFFCFSKELNESRDLDSYKIGFLNGLLAAVVS